MTEKREPLDVISELEQLTEDFAVKFIGLAGQLELAEARTVKETLAGYLSDLAGDTFRFWRKLVESRDEIGDDR